MSRHTTTLNSALWCVKEGMDGSPTYPSSATISLQSAPASMYLMIPLQRCFDRLEGMGTIDLCPFGCWPNVTLVLYTVFMRRFVANFVICIVCFCCFCWRCCRGTLWEKCRTKWVVKWCDLLSWKVMQLAAMTSAPELNLMRMWCKSRFFVGGWVRLIHCWWASCSNVW